MKVLMAHHVSLKYRNKLIDYEEYVSEEWQKRICKNLLTAFSSAVMYWLALSDVRALFVLTENKWSLVRQWDLRIHWKRESLHIMVRSAR